MGDGGLPPGGLCEVETGAELVEAVDELVREVLVGAGGGPVGGPLGGGTSLSLYLAQRSDMRDDEIRGGPLRGQLGGMGKPLTEKIGGGRGCTQPPPCEIEGEGVRGLRGPYEKAPGPIHPLK